MISTALSDFINQLPELTPHIVVGYSGGVDSHVLLYALVQLQKKNLCTLSAIHVHHGLSQNANAWQAHCEKICQALSIPLTVNSIVVNRQGKGLEAAAREARYQSFKENMPDKAYLCLAHHQDDQMETLLLRLLRGTGVLGLQGMLPVMPLHHFRVARPLLEIPRAEILAYAQALDLQWVEDESNHNLHFQRNYLRHRIIPLLREQWPALGNRFSDVSHWSAEVQQICDDQAEQDYQHILLRGTNQGVAEGGALNRFLMMNLSSARQKNVLRYWLRSCGIPMPSAEQLAEIQQQCLVPTKTQDRHPRVILGDVCVAAFQEGLYLLVALPQTVSEAASAVQTLGGRDAAAKPTGMYSQRVCTALAASDMQAGVEVTEVRGKGLKKSLWNHPGLNIKNRVGGERFQLTGHPHHTSLKKILHANKVAPWLRDTMPLVFLDDQLIAIPALALVAEGFAASDREMGIEFIFSVSSFELKN